MSEHKFSNSVQNSLDGRIQSQIDQFLKPSSKKNNNEIVSTQLDKKGHFDRGLGKNADGTFKQSNAGRRSIDKSKKKVQLPLTLTPATKESLDKWAETKPRSAANYISEYVEEHLDEIMSYFNK